MEDEPGAGSLTSSAVDFVAAAVGRAEEERDAARRQPRRLRAGLVTGVCVLIVLAAVFGLLWTSSITQERRAEQQHTVAAAKGLVFRAESLRESDLSTALRLGVAAHTLDATPESRAGLVAGLLQQRDALYLDAQTRKVTATHAGGGGGAVDEVAYSPSGRVVACAGADGSFTLWDVSNRVRPVRLSQTPAGPGALLAPGFGPKGQLLATGDDEGVVRLWDVSRPARPRQKAELTGHGKRVESLAISPDGQTLLAGTSGRDAVLWDISDTEDPWELGRLDGGGAGPVHGVAYSDDGASVLIDGIGDTPYVWDVYYPDDPVQSGFIPVRGSGAVQSVAFAPARLLATGTDEKETLLWDTSDPSRPERLARLTGLDGQNTSVAFQPHGHVLATATGDGAFGDDSSILWDVRDPTRPRRIQKLRDGPVTSLAFSADGRTLVTTTYRKAHLWDVASDGTARHLAGFSGDGLSVETTAVSSDGRTVAVAETAAQQVALYDIGDRSRPRVLALPSRASPVSAIAFSPTAPVIAVGAQDGAIVLWDVTERSSPRRLTELKGIRSEVTNLSFGPDGRHVVATEWGAKVSAARTITWDVSRIAAIVTHPAERACVLSGRGLSREEWSRYTDGLPFRNTCGSSR